MKASTAFIYELILAIILSCFLGYMIGSTVMWSNHTCPERTSTYAPYVSSYDDMRESSNEVREKLKRLQVDIEEMKNEVLQSDMEVL